MVNRKILNLSLPKTDQNCSTRFRVSQKTDFQQVRDLCLRALPGQPASVQLVSLESGSQEISVSFWVQDLKEGAQAMTNFIFALLESCRKQGIGSSSASVLTRRDKIPFISLA